MTTAARRTLMLIVVLAAGLLATPVAAQLEPPPDEPATALRVAIGRALGEHAFLVGEVVRSGIAGGADFTAAADALEENSSAVVGVIEDVYGAEASEAFGEQWRNHVAYIVDYARAVTEDDEEAAQLASAQLDRYVTTFSGFLAEAMPDLPPDAVEGLIGEHVQQLEHVASFHEADFDDAYGAIRETYAHMFEVGDALTSGIVSLFPDRFTGQSVAFSPATDLRILLDRQLGEHTYLAAVAMRAVLRDGADAESAEDALTANSEDLEATIGQVYGAEAGAAFAALWEGHVRAYVAYVAAIRDGDEAAAEAALEDLAEYRSDFSAYVADANPFIAGDVLEAMIGDHTEHLVAQADAYAAGDRALSYQIGREAYAHTGELSHRLAVAIAGQFPQIFPNVAVRRAEAPISAVGAGLLVAGAALVLATAAGARARAARGEAVGTNEPAPGRLALSPRDGGRRPPRSGHRSRTR